MKPALHSLSLLLFLSVAGAPAAPEAPGELTARPVTNKLGLHLNEYELSWKPRGAWHEVLVASDQAKLAAGVGDMWESGRRSAEQDAPWVPYLGRALQSGEPVWWKVRVWNGEHEVSDWSAAQRIEIPSADEGAQLLPRPTGSSGANFEFVAGRTGRALRFGGDRPLVWSDDYENLRSAQATTIAAWIRPEKVGDEWQCIYRKEDGSNRRLLAIGKEGEFWGVWCGFGIGGNYVEFGAPYDRNKLSDGNWHHVAVTYDGNHLRLYVDGAKIGEKRQPGALGSGNARACIGSHNDGERFRGALDEVAVYATALSGEQMAALFEGKRSDSFPAPVGMWKFEDNILNEIKSVRERSRNRVVLVGGTLISRMDQHGYFETALTVRWPQHDIGFRNLGWPADDVFGTARSEFGSAHNTRSWQPPRGQRGFGFEKLKGQLADAQPSTVIVGYGGEAAFAETPEQMERFEEGYRALIGELEQTGATLILLSPILQAPHGRIQQDVSEKNERLKAAARFIIALAKARNHTGIDLTSPNPFGGPLAGSSYENGLHLGPAGYRRLARRLCEALGVELAGAPRKAGIPPQRAGSGIVSNHEATRLGSRYDFTRDRLPSLHHDEPGSGGAGREPRIWIDGEEVIVDGQDGLIRSGADHDQSEKLRRAIIEKNQLHRYKLNPINKAYIFLFRRHEMGHLAYEMEDFDVLVKGREQAIAKLRVPRAHRYELEDPREWRAPRDYPDHEVPKNIPAPDVAAELKAFKVADGFEVNLWAKNPVIFNPINLNWDRRGRAWVSTSSTYPHIKPGRIPNDRIVILEDVDRDGVAERHIVFAEGLTVPHSVMPVEGGAYVCSTTEVLFLADHDGDDRADEKRVIFSGFGNADVHHMIHGLRWAPWGDLFFTQSIYINSFVETAHGPRRLNGSGVWRFRPEIERIDVFSRGRVNPWGHALDYWGNSFGTDGAGGQGPHDLFPGSAFGTAVGAPRVLGGLVPGKPKNTAAEFMTGRHLPSEWHGTILANDFRANRTVRYDLEESGSGFKSREVETVLHSSHRSYRPVDIKMGPDGAVYIVDWYNPIIDHGEVDFHHPLRDKSHGRIWRLTAKGRPLVEVPDFVNATVPELLDYLKLPEQFTRTQANRELVGRKVSRDEIDAWVAGLDASEPSHDHHVLEALWLVTALNLDPGGLEERPLRSADPRIRAAAVRVVGRTTDGLSQLAVAVEDEHPRVRLEAVSALRGLGTGKAAEVAMRALDYEVDRNLDFALEMTVRDTRDSWLPAMQSGKRVFDGNANRLSYALNKVNDARAVGALAGLIDAGGLEGEELSNAVAMVSSLGSPEQLGKLLERAKQHPEWLTAIARGVRFNRQAPQGKERVREFLSSGDSSVRLAAATLCGAWKIGAAKEQLVGVARSSTSEDDALTVATALAEIGATDSLAALGEAGQPLRLRIAAAAAAARLDPAANAARASAILGAMKNSTGADSILGAFLSRDEGPSALAGALADQKLEEEVAIAASRVASASGREVSELLTALNKAGGLKPVATQLSPEQRRTLISDARERGSAERGRKIFERPAMACVSCHLVNGRGGKLGPDLSTVGSYMTPESLLESLLNPSTDIKQGYETVMVTRKDQTLVSGLLQRKTDNAVLVRDPSGEVLSIPSGEIAKIDTSPVSLMPPGLTATLRRDELVDLMSYLTNLGAAAKNKAPEGN